MTILLELRNNSKWMEILKLLNWSKENLLDFISSPVCFSKKQIIRMLPTSIKKKDLLLEKYKSGGYLKKNDVDFITYYTCDKLTMGCKKNKLVTDGQLLDDSVSEIAILFDKFINDVPSSH